MHRTNLLPKAVLWGLLLALGLASPATAQEAKPAPSIVVSLGSVHRLQMSKKQPIARAINKNEAIVRLTSVQGDPTTILVVSLDTGIAAVTLEDGMGNKEDFQIIVQLDIELLKSLIKRAVPTADVTPIPGANNVVILTGTVARAEDIDVIVQTARSVLRRGAGAADDPIINALRVGGVQQVQLCVVVARVNRSETRNLGFSFLETGHKHFIGSSVSGSGSLAGTILSAVAAPVGNFSSSPNAVFGIINDDQGFIGFLNALRTEGLAKLLAEPRVVTQSGHVAYIVSGGETPILTANQNGQSISYRQFGTVVNCLPIVLGNGKIHLQVRPEISFRNAANDINITTAFGTTFAPGFDTQSASVTVELEAGQTLAIGGLISHTVNGTTTKVPLLGDLPFLGAAFSTKQFTESEEELLILVTPHLVDAMSCDQLPRLLPGMETRSPDDFELFLEGILEAPRGPRAVKQGHYYVAPYKNSPTASQFPCAGGPCRGSEAVSGPATPTVPPPPPPAAQPLPTGVTPAAADAPAAGNATEDRPAALPPALTKDN